jgi:pyridinium-3,5-bisthiocarboxylic acid mononucleotide nickel chelatase
MTTFAFFDCFSGISGNMALGALLDCGVDLDSLSADLQQLDLKGYRLDVRETEKVHLRGLHVEVPVEGDQPHRHLRDIQELIGASALAPRIRERSLLAFQKLAQAEAKVHGEPVEKIHFHEVGAVDAIVDIVGSMICLEHLGVDAVYASALHIGAGTVKSAHGVLPVPAPATVELLRGAPVYGRDVEAELVTPTGAAILAAVAAGFGDAPAMRVERTGYGAGTRDLPWANLLRVTIGRAEEPAAGGRVHVIEANIDDMNPQWYEHAMDRLFAAGALDVYLTPIQMKRNRPAITLSVMTEEACRDAVLGVLFAETTTIGIRMHAVERRKLDREERTVATAYGAVKIKIARWEGKVMNVSPEYRDCLRIAGEKGLPVKEVWLAALAASRALQI